MPVFSYIGSCKGIIFHFFIYSQADGHSQQHGVAQPVSILVNTYGTGKLSDEEITEIVKKNFDLRPAAIIKNFDLKRPIYKQVAAYGHFGRTDLDLPWEKLDMVDVFKERV